MKTASGRLARSGLALALAFCVADAEATTSYITDDLLLGVYADEHQQGQRLATLHSGTQVDTIAVAGEYAQIQLADGRTGWVKSSFLVERKPAVVRVKELEAQLANTPGPTAPGAAGPVVDFAARAQIDQLKAQLATAKAELQAARTPAAQSAAQPVEAPRDASAAADAEQTDAPTSTLGAAARAGRSVLRGILHFFQTPLGVGFTILAALALGFWSGYAVLALRVRRRFGGIKVY